MMSILPSKRMNAIKMMPYIGVEPFGRFVWFKSMRWYKKRNSIVNKIFQVSPNEFNVTGGEAKTKITV